MGSVEGGRDLGRDQASEARMKRQEYVVADNQIAFG
jgi:hypothetical protein